VTNTNEEVLEYEENTAQAKPELLEESNPFSTPKWLSDQMQKKGISETRATQSVFQRKKRFNDLCQIVKTELRHIIEDSNSSDQSEWMERQHQAIIGDLDAMGYFINKIEDVLRRKNMTSVDVPSYYNSLSEAIFHEVWGKSILAKWDNRYPNSESAMIIGRELWIDVDGQMVKQPEHFESDEKVKKIIEAFKMRDPNAVLNYQNPELEIEHEDGSRITMVSPPRGKELYVVFRRFIVNNFSLEEQARLNTIPQEDVHIYRCLSRTLCNTVFAGRVRSAKSTFMKTMITERDSNLTIGLLEKDFELALKKHMPDRLIYELRASEGDLHTAIPRLLRMEHDFIVIGEIRSKEMEGAMMACERGERGFMSTYHLTDADQVVPQLTRHLLDEYPSRSFSIEQERVAQNIDLIITMGTDRDRKIKRVTGVYEVHWNPDKRQQEIRTIIKYHKRKNKYFYSLNFSKRLLSLMVDENEEATNELVKMLKEREEHSPLSDLNQEGDLPK